ncbi:MAG: ABC transporter substrate-binding protein [Acetobacteraceae bacterium]
MQQKILIALSALSGLALAAPAGAAPFKCPTTGGNFMFGQAANVNSLDQMASDTISTRNIAMNIYEALMTRSESDQPILQLAQSVARSPDGMTYTFQLRQGVHFQNGQLMTSKDVVASFNRYAKVGLERGLLTDVQSWDAAAPFTFVVHMKKPEPTFLEQLSSFSAPLVIIPASQEHVPALQLKPIGTGPYELEQSVPGSYVKLKRFSGYSPDTRYDNETGLGGYKVACFDTVTFRIVTEPGARVAGLRTGELQGVEDVPAKSVPGLEKDKNITIMPLHNWWIQIAEPNTANAPTDNLWFRKAVQAGLDMKAIMQAASDGFYRLNVGFQYPSQGADYSDAGKSTYNINNPKLAKEYLAKAGYHGEPVILLTDHDYPQMYNSAIVMQSQLQALGINAKLHVTDWPTSVQIANTQTSGWNFFFTGWGTEPALGPLAIGEYFGRPAPVYFPPKGHPDPELVKLWNEMNTVPTAAERHKVFAKLQKYALDQVYALPFGSLTLIQAVRSDVKGFVPFRIPRMYNVWFQK